MSEVGSSIFILVWVGDLRGVWWLIVMVVFVSVMEWVIIFSWVLVLKWVRVMHSVFWSEPIHLSCVIEVEVFSSRCCSRVMWISWSVFMFV